MAGVLEFWNGDLREEIRKLVGYPNPTSLSANSTSSRHTIGTTTAAIIRKSHSFRRVTAGGFARNRSPGSRLLGCSFRRLRLIQKVQFNHALREDSRNPN